jgi:hypothetical protein
MRIHTKEFTLALVLALLLTACAKSESADISQSVEDTMNLTVESTDIWQIELVPVNGEYESASPICDESPGEFSECEFLLKVKNVSKLPQTLEGIYFLETSDGTVYQEKKRWFESFTGVVNPGEDALQGAKFDVPFQGELIARMYRAWGATAEPIFSHTFEPMWEMKYG